MLRIGAGIGTVIATGFFTPIIGSAFALKNTIAAILYLLSIPFMPMVITYKLVRFVDAYIVKRRELKKYMEALEDNEVDQANDMRIAEAEKIVKALESLDNDKSLDERMNPKDRDKFRENMIAFFSDEDRDMSNLMDTAKKMERIASQNKGKKKSINLNVDMKGENYQPVIINQAVKSFQSRSEEPAHNNHENYKTVHN